MSFNAIRENKILGKISESTVNCDYFLIHQLKHVFWVLKRTVSFETVVLGTHNIYFG